MVIGGSVSRGVGAAVVGGNFYEEAVFGLISSILNHVAHEVSDLIQSDKAKIYITVTDEIIVSAKYTTKNSDFQDVEDETPVYKAIISGLDKVGNAV